PLPQIRAFFDRALLEVVVLGGEPEVLVLHVRELSLETDDRLLRRFDQRPGFRARRLLRGGGLRLLWFVVHGPALHEQSVCRPRCAVLAGLVGVRARKERSDKQIAARVGPAEAPGALVTAGGP